MKGYVISAIIFFFSLGLISCVTNRNITVEADISREIWKQTVATNPKTWLRQADSWFLTGEPNATEIADHHAPNDAAITMTTVRTAPFTKIEVNGDFQVQIFASDQNSVYVLGPNAGAHGVGVEVVGKTLNVRQTEKIPQPVMRKVIIRIGVKKLNQLVQRGSGPISAIFIRSASLCVESSGSGDIYLSGHVNVTRIVSGGAGCIFILGADTRLLDIITSGSGTVSICGRVGLKSITHHGSGDINIIGARSHQLNIEADGKGKIGLCGWYINLCSITAKDDTCVYLYNVYGNHITVNSYGNAQVGLLGRAKELYVNTFNSSLFLGRYLCVHTAYVSAKGSSHVNVTASTKVYATASQSGTVYFFGPGSLLTSYVSGDGAVMPMRERNGCNYRSEYRPYAYTYSHLGETLLYRHNLKCANLDYKGEA